MFSTSPVRKPYVAIILLFEDFKKPLSQSRIDSLYKALQPSSEDMAHYDLIAPAKLSRIIAEKKLETSHADRLLSDLRKHLDLQDVVVVTVRDSGEHYGIRSRLIRTSTGETVKEHGVDVSSYSELKSRLRETAYAVLSGETQN